MLCDRKQLTPRGGYSWEFLVGAKNVIFHTRFQTRRLTFTPVFKPGPQTEIMSSSLRLERKQKNSSNQFRIRIFLRLSFTFGIETINTFIHSCSSLENYTRFQTKIGKICARFQTKDAQKPCPNGGGTYLYSSPPPGLTPLNGKRQELTTQGKTCCNDIYFFYRFFIELYIYTPVLYIPCFRIWGDIPPFRDSIPPSFRLFWRKWCAIQLNIVYVGLEC